MQPDPNLGISVPDFPTSQFEAAIRFAMQMGAPVDPDKRPKFIMGEDGVTYWRDGVQIETPRLDRDGRPLDPHVETRRTTPTVVTVDCAVEMEGGAAPGEGPVGNFPNTRVVVTLLEAEWAQVQHAQALEYNGDRYRYDHEPTNYGLFDAGVHTLIFVSEDET